MSTPPALPNCAICESPLALGEHRCPACQASPAWRDLAEALDFAGRRFAEWQQEGNVTAAQQERLGEHYRQRRRETVDAARAGQAFPQGTGLPPQDQCWNCHAFARGDDGHCEECGVSMTGPGVRSLRAWKFLEREVSNHERTGLLSLYQSHEFDKRIKGKMAALRSRLTKDRAGPPPLPKRKRDLLRETFGSERDAAPRRSLLEIVLDPQSIQWLLASGGVLLVLGLVIWLASLGLFDNPGVVAVLLGIGNGLVLLGGWAVIRFTRYQLAGRSLTLLACLVMPLNLWFYHAHGLITLHGHLWVAALVCCGIYAASAAVLRDPLFVYVLCGGLALTGLLFLADFGKLEQIFAPSALLVFLGLVALHAERAFPKGEGPFTRQGFGLAFFWSAQALLGAGLFLLLGAQLIGIFPQAFALPRPEVAELASLPKTLLVVLAGTYAFLYSDLVVRRVGVYIYFAAFTLLWAEIQFLVLLHAGAPLVLIVLALTGLAVNLLPVALGQDRGFLRSVPPLALFLTLLPVLYGVVLHFRATNVELARVWPSPITWGHMAAMLITALCARAGAFIHRHSMPLVSATYFFATAAATLVGAASLAWLLGFQPWETQAPLLMLIPIAYLVAARLYRGHTPEDPLNWVAQASTLIMLLSSLWAALEITPQVVQPITGKTLNLLLMLVCAEAALFYGLAAAFRKGSWNVYLATVMLCGALWQLLSYLNTPEEYYTLAFAVAGFALLVAYRLALLENLQRTGLSQAAFQSANVLLSLGFLSGALLTLARLLMTVQALANLAGGGDWKSPIRLLIFLLTALQVLSLAAAWLVQHPAWRRWYVVLTVANGAALLLALHRLSVLSPWQKLEIFSIVAGAALLVAGHIAWYREQGRDEESDMVGFCLSFGSLLVAVPLLIAVAVYRFGFTLSGVNEFGLVLAAILLFGSGVMCRLKATTLVGGISMALYVILVLAYMHRFLKDQVIVGIYLTLGGSLLFGTGLVLSLYRDRLLALPQKIKRREGIFKILNWR